MMLITVHGFIISRSRLHYFIFREADPSFVLRSESLHDLCRLVISLFALEMLSIEAFFVRLISSCDCLSK